MMEKNNIDELFRSKLHDYSLEAPDHVWDNIVAQRTPLHRAINYFKNKRGAAAGVLALLIGLSAVAYLGMVDTQSHAQQEYIALTNTPAPQTDNSVTTPLTAPAGDEVQTNAATPATTATNTANNGTASTNGRSRRPASNNGTYTRPVAPANGTPNTPTTPTADGGDNNNHSDNNTNPVTNTNPTPDKPNPTIDGNTLLNNNPDNSTPAPQADKQEVPAADAGPVLADNTDNSNNAADGIEGADKTTNSERLAVKPEKHKCNSLTADVYGSVDFAGRSLSATGADASYFNAKKQSESYRPGFTAGVRVNLDLNKAKTIKLRVGLQYSRLGERLNYNGEQKYTRMDTSIGYVIDPNTGLPTGATYTRITEVTETKNVSVAANNTYTFIDVPVQLELSVYKSKQLSLFATGGAAINLRFAQRGMQLNHDLSGSNEIRSANPYKTTTGFSVLGGIGGEYKFSETSQYSLLVEGTYRHGLGNVYGSGSGLNQSFRTLSGTVGLRYRF